MRVVKGMVQVSGTTYRVVRVGPGSYEVIRILDDTRIGNFLTTPRVEIVATMKADMISMMRPTIDTELRSQTSEISSSPTHADQSAVRTDNCRAPRSFDRFQS